uniref:Calcium binding and coiled-coil domain-containing protein n=1 Tax=Strigamia maritima TaxID=126957 RepID=T1J9P7_STRMM
MATLQLKLKQVNFDASDYPEYESELEDPISNVVDANTDFQIVSDQISLCNSFASQPDLNYKIVKSEEIESELRRNSIERDKFSTVDLPKVHEKSLQRVCGTANGDCGDPSYPGISPDVARYIYQMNPDVITTVEAALKPDSKKISQINIIKSNLTCLQNTSETFALQQSNLGNRMNSTSPEITKPTESIKPLEFVKIPEPNHKSPLLQNNHKNGDEQPPTTPTDPSQKILHKFPQERITTITERKPSWFLSDPPPVEPSIHKPPLPSRRSSRSSQSSTMSTPRRGDFATNDAPALDISPISDKSDSRSLGSTESAYSDKYELDSNYSDLLETQSLASNMSEMSSVSGIEEEMYRIKKLLLEVPTLPDDHPDFHKRSVIFGRTGGVVVSDDCLEADRFVVSQEVFFELQREKANLEGQIETLRTQLDEYTSEKRVLLDQLTVSQTQVKIKTLESEKEKSEREKLSSRLQFMQQVNKKSDGSNAQLQMNLESKATDLAQIKDDLRDLEECNARLRIDGEELRMELEAKEGAVRGLKSKIAELHVESQLATQAKIQAVNDQQLVKSEMDALQKSREWYRTQLHGVQESRNKMQQELLNLQGAIVAQKNEMEKQRNDNAMTKLSLTEVQQRAVKEKETLMRHLESIKEDMLVREASFVKMEVAKGVVEEESIERLRGVREEKWKMNVCDLEEQVARLKVEISAKNEGFKGLEANYVEIMRKLTVAEKGVNERDVEIQRKGEKCVEFEGKVKELKMRLESKEEQVNAMKDAKTATEIALAAANKEKRDVDEALNVVRQNLVKLNANFRKIKTDLANRDASIDQLIKEKNKMESMLMESGQKIIALKTNYESYSNELKSRDGIIQEVKEIKSKLTEELDKSREKIVSLEEIVVRVRNEKASITQKCVDLQNEVLRTENELKTSQNDKKEVESQLEKFLTSIPVTNPDETSEKRVRRNSQDLSDGTKILNDPCDQIAESYPRDELEREVLLMRQALDTREKQVEKYLRDKNEMQHVIDELRKENASLGRGLTSDGDEGRLEHHIEAQLGVYRRKVKELEGVLEFSGVKRRNFEVETQTDNVSFMKHVLEQDDRNSVTQGRFENLEAEYRERQRVYDSNIKVLTRKLKEVMKAHKKAEVELKNWRVAVARNQGDEKGDMAKVITAPDLPGNHKSERNLKREILHYRAKVKGLQIKLKEAQTNYEDMKTLVEANKEAMLDLERERGKLTGVNQSNEALKSHAQRLESALAEKDVAVTELDIAKKDLTSKQAEEEFRNKQWIEELEINLTAERETAKELRKQVSFCVIVNY